eukprot:997608_1
MHALACYILKDWNEEVTPQEVKENGLSLIIAKVCHSAPLSDKNDVALFGYPFVISFLNVHTQRQVHQVIYERLFTWVGPLVLRKPPIITKLKKIPKAKKNNKEKEEYEYVKPTKEEIVTYEAQWDQILKSLPYTLRVPPITKILINDVVFVIPTISETVKSDNIIIEWGAEAYNKIKTVVNGHEYYRGGEYDKWMKDKLKQQQPADIIINDANVYLE